jgi:hypothetical protein
MSTAHSQLGPAAAADMVLAGYAAGLAAEIAGGLLRPLHFIRTRSDYDARHATHRTKFASRHTYSERCAAHLLDYVSGAPETEAVERCACGEQKSALLLCPGGIFSHTPAAASNSFGACSGCHLGKLDAVLHCK